MGNETSTTHGGGKSTGYKLNNTPNNTSNNITPTNRTTNKVNSQDRSLRHDFETEEEFTYRTSAAKAAENRINSKKIMKTASEKLEKGLALDMKVQEEKLKKIEAFLKSQSTNDKVEEKLDEKVDSVNNIDIETFMQNIDMTPIPELENALQQLSDNSPENIESAKKILSTILKNILLKSDPTFHRIKVASKAITTLKSINGAFLALNVTGFKLSEPDDGYLTIHSQFDKEYVARCLFFITMN